MCDDDDSPKIVLDNFDAFFLHFFQKISMKRIFWLYFVITRTTTHIVT